MDPELSTPLVRAYFLIDRTKQMDEYIEHIQQLLNTLLTKFDQSSRIGHLTLRFEPRVIEMRAATSQVTEWSKSKQFRLSHHPPGCDLGEALRLVEDSLRETEQAGQGNIELFILLYSEPAGDWKSRIERLKTRPEIRATVVALSDEVEAKTLKAIATSPDGAGRRSGGLVATRLNEAFIWINDILNYSLNTLSSPPLAPGPAAVQPQPLPVMSASLAASPEVSKSELTIGEVDKMDPDDIATIPAPKKRPENMAAQSGSKETSAQTSDQPLKIDLAGEPAEPKIVAPAVDESGKATIWKEVDPPPELDDRVAHTDQKAISAAGNWHIIGASRRGKMHAHKGIFREDGMALKEVNGWHLMVVADGGGSCPLSRVGSQLAADVAVTTMSEFIKSMVESETPVEEVCEVALRRAVEMSWKALEAEANKREIPLGHLGTTFLSVVHRPGEDSDILGVAQVGDGLVAAELADGRIVTLAEPDVGATAGVTFFLTSKPWQEWLDRVQVQTLPASPRLLAAMCDGVADDFIPFEDYLPKLFDGLKKVMGEESPEEALLELLGYDKRGSFDDRTLTLIYKAETGTKTEVTPAAEERVVEVEPDAAPAELNLAPIKTIQLPDMN